MTNRPGIPGIAIGPAWQHRPGAIIVPEEPSQGGRAECERLATARSAARTEFRQARSHLTGEAAEILDVHLQLLDDPEIVSAAERAILVGGQTAEHAWSAAVVTAAIAAKTADDPDRRALAADIGVVGRAVLIAFTGATLKPTARHGILIARDLAPAEAAQLDPSITSAVVLAHSSPTGHAVILTRARGVPVIASAGDWVLGIPDGTTVIADSGSGTVIAGPSHDALDEYQQRARRLATIRAHDLTLARKPARTRSGITVTVGASIGSVADATAAERNGADMAGVVRTEFLFLNRTTPPEADDQYDTYRAIASELGGKRITIRTLDIGGDKTLPYLPTAVERNPMLGVRGIRYSLTHRDLFATQLIAVARLAREAPVSVLFPFVSTVGELMTARSMVDAAIRRTGTHRPATFRVGMMVEVPSAALNIAQFAPALDFVSIGTNDLTQYTFAVERGNDQVSGLAATDDPAIFDLIGRVCAQHPHVTICGELATQTRALPRLLDLGIRSLSVPPRTIPTVKSAIRELGA